MLKLKETTFVYCLISVLMVFFTYREAIAKVKVVTTIPDLAQITKEIGGDKVETSYMCKGTQDPHFVDPRPSFVVLLNQADLLIYVGAQLEVGWLPPLIRQARNTKIQPLKPGHLNGSSVVKLLEVQKQVDRAQGDIHPVGNPHWWLDPYNGIRVAEEIARRLKTIDPSNGSYYENNLKGFVDRLRRKIKEWEAMLIPYKGTRLVMYHKSWVYFNRWAQFEEAGFIEPKPGIPPSASHIGELIKTLKGSGVKLVISESYYPSRTAELVAQKLNAKYIQLPSMVGGRPEIKTYMQLIEAIVTDIVNGLKNR